MGKVKVQKDNTERYLLTYADLMNLLLILFIILFAYSQVDTQKFQQLSQSLGAAFGNGSSTYISGSDSGNSLVNFPANMPSAVIPSKLEDAQVNEAAKEANEMFESKGLGGSVDVKVQERGIVISIKDSLLFKSGSAEIEKPNVVLQIGKELLATMPGKHIRIEGHTDNVPINTPKFPSNWELASARATNVLKLLVYQAGIDYKLINAVTYADSVPLVPNTSDENRAKNRRVDIVILRDSSTAGEAGNDTAITNSINSGSKTTNTNK
jgi:chemotaxis protein MotB